MYLKGMVMRLTKTNVTNEFRRYIIDNWSMFNDIENQLDNEQRLLIRQCMAEQGLELTPDEIDEILFLIISIKRNITPFDLIWNIERN